MLVRLSPRCRAFAAIAVIIIYALVTLASDLYRLIQRRRPSTPLPPEYALSSVQEIRRLLPSGTVGYVTDKATEISYVRLQYQLVPLVLDTDRLHATNIGRFEDAASVDSFARSHGLTIERRIDRDLSLLGASSH